MSHHDDCVEMLGRRLDPRHKNLVQEEILDELVAYRNERKPVSIPFLVAVLENNLLEAAVLTNYDSVLTLPAVVAFCQSFLPVGSWGSPEAVAVWVGQPVPEGSSPGANAKQQEAISAMVAEVQKGLAELNPKDPRANRYKTLAKILETVTDVKLQDAETKEETKVPA